MSEGEPGTSPALRASDAERERTATLLRDHAAAGRLTPEELDERLETAYRARTVGELTALTHDLPATADPTRSKPARSRALARAGVRERTLHAIGLVVLVNVTCNAIWLAAGAESPWWPKWVLLATVLRLAFQLWAALGPGAHDEARLGRGGVAPRAPLAPPPPPPSPRELPREPGDER